MLKRRQGPRLRVSAIGAVALMALLTALPAETPVADAAQRGEMETVRSLLKGGADVNAAQGDGMTALHWAAMNGNEAMVEVLIYAGANLGPTTRLGAYTPVHLAARNGRASTLTVLLEAGADARTRTSTGVTSIHFAAASGVVDAVSALIAHGADVNATGSVAGRTPLMFATANNRIEVVDLLLSRGADVATATRVVDYAAQARTDRKAEQLRDQLMAAARAVEEGVLPADEEDEEDRAFGSGTTVADASAAQLQSRDQDAAADEEDEARERAEAAKAKAEGQEDPPRQHVADASAAQLQSRDQTSVSESGPSDEPRPLSFSDLVGSQGGLTALHYAARDGHTEIARLLIEAGMDVDMPTPGDQSTPLLVAAINGNYDLAMFLLEKGADPRLASEDGATPLYATLNNRWAPKALYPQPTAFKQQATTYLEFMAALLGSGADPNVRLKTHIWYTSYNFDLLGVNFQGATAFWRAAYATDVPAMRLLIAHGADPNIPTTKAPQRRFRGRASGDGDKEDPSGLAPVPIGGPAVYPIHAASGVGYGLSRAGNSHRHAPNGWLPTVKYLIEELGADVDVRDHDGFSALHHAAARGDDDMIRYLVEKGADVTFVSRRGQTTVDMANGPQQRVQPFPETIALLEGFGAKNNHNCLSC